MRNTSVEKLRLRWGMKTAWSPSDLVSRHSNRSLVIELRDDWSRLQKDPTSTDIEAGYHRETTVLPSTA